MSSLHFIALQTLLHRELVRIFRIWKQTFIPPIITQTLYFVVFGAFIGSQVAPVAGISYMAFIVPGIVMMSMITGAFINVSFSFYFTKFGRSVEEMLVSPMPDWLMLVGYVTAGVVRALLTGAVILVVSALFVRPTIEHVWVMLLFATLTAAVFGLGGFLNGMLAKDFDGAGSFATFVLTPLTYLGGVFYSLDMLPPVFKAISYANPIVYMVDGFRYGFYGIHDTNLWLGFGFLLIVGGILTTINLVLLKKGTGLRS
ncbi:MAG: hypothetical protein RL141_828 [Candidatus Parcubacteria bacterium]|jgi:ABC-2 type transport system permease protein